MSKVLLRALLGLVTTVAAVGCGKVEHCRERQARCIGGACEDGECDFDLVCAVRPTGDRLCGKPLGDKEYDFGEKGGRGPAIPADELGPPCECDAPEVCSVDTNACVNYCEVPDALPGSVPVPEVIFCEHEEGETPFTFDEICRRRCLLQCQRWEQFCGHTCAANYCDGIDIQTACLNECPLIEGDQLLCMTRACNSVRDSGCGDAICPDTNEPPDCRGVVCRNECGLTSNEWSGDGVCDDGDLLSATYADCAWGTDCTDCGPRRGSAPEPAPHGGQCAFNTGCKGYTQDLKTNAAWCMSFNELAQGLARCVPDCSRGQPCPDGYECVTVKDGEGEPITDEDLTGRACLPTVCE